MNILFFILVLIESVINPSFCSTTDQNYSENKQGNSKSASIQLNYEILGDTSNEKIPLVLIHGLGADLHVFDSIADILSEKFQVIVYDQRGHGKSPAIGYDYSLIKLAADLKDLLDQIGIKKAHILGHSFGGRTAIKFAALYPDYVQSLVIEDMDTCSRHRKNSRKLDDVVKDAKKMASLPKKFWAAEELQKALAPLIGYYRAGEAAARALSISIIRGMDFLTNPVSKYFAERLYEFESNKANLTPDLEKVEAPTLFLKGGQGCGMSKKGVQIVEDLGKKFPHIQLKTIEEGDHIIHASEPNAFLEVFVAFLLNHSKTSTD